MFGNKLVSFIEIFRFFDRQGFDAFHSTSCDTCQRTAWQKLYHTGYACFSHSLLAQIPANWCSDLTDEPLYKGIARLDEFTIAILSQSNSGLASFQGLR